MSFVLQAIQSDRAKLKLQLAKAEKLPDRVEAERLADGYRRQLDHLDQVERAYRDRIKEVTA